MSLNIAEQIAERFDNDGTRWTDDSGIELADACRAAGATVDRRGSDVKFRFADGSTVIATVGAWDLGLSGAEACWCWQGMGTHADDCPLAVTGRA